MGIALILLGLLGAATVVDFVIENDFAGAPDQTFALFGGTFTRNETAVVLTAAVIGGLAVLLIMSGIALSRGSMGRRRGYRRRISDLERENADLRTSTGRLEAERSEPNVVVVDRPTEQPARPDMEREREPAHRS